MPYSGWMLPETVVRYVVGLDLAPLQDPTALAILEQTVSPRDGTSCYACRYLQRWPVGTGYRDIHTELQRLLSARHTHGGTVLPEVHLVVDRTGVGRAVVELFGQMPQVPGYLVPVLVSAGHTVSRDPCDGTWCLPRQELVGTLQALMQTGRLKLAAALPQMATLVHELQHFRAKVKLAAADSLEDWRQRDHDDLVLALAIPLWYAEQHPILFDTQECIQMVCR